MSSLLASLYSRIKGSPEDVATLSLCYILDNSKSANEAFHNYLSTVSGIGTFPDLFFKTQAVGKDQERPDLVGTDYHNNELLICEAKFWAGLTVSQPLKYLERLRRNESQLSKALVFICPKDRIISLWGELLRRCDQTFDSCADDTKESKRTKFEGVALAIVSWKSVIDVLMQTLSAEHSPLVGDLSQLQGLCEKMDTDAFSPFSGEDFGVDRARRILSFYKVVDGVADQLKNVMGATSNGLKATPQYAGYRRYLNISRYGISIAFDCKSWIDSADTPFWLTIRDSTGEHWTFDQVAREKLRSYEYSIPKKLFVHEGWGELRIPIYAPVNTCETDVINKIVTDIVEVFDKLDCPHPTETSI